MKKKTLISAISALIIVLGALSFFIFPGQLTGHMTKEDSINIGVITPLTGNFATLGTGVKNGFVLAQEELQQELGTSINIVYEDACFPKETVTALNKMINIDQIDILGGSFCLVGFVPLIPTLEQEQIIGFNTAANPDDTLNKQYIFSTNKAITDDAKTLVEFAINELDAKTAAIVYYTTPLGIDYDKYLQQHFKALNGKITSSHAVDVSNLDYRTVLTRIKADNPDVIFIIQLSQPLGSFIKQTRELGIDAQLLTRSEAEDPNMLKVAGVASEGLIVSSAEPAQKSRNMKEFKERYSKRFGINPDILAANAYDSLQIQVHVYNACKGNTQCMLTKLQELENFPGVSGAITIQPNGASKRPTVFKIVKDGKFVKY